MSVRTKGGLGFTDCISQKELGWDESAFSVFTTTSEDVEGRPTFYSDKSSEDNISDFASCDSSGKSLEYKPTEIESNVGTPITEPISVKDLPSFTCNCFGKTDHTSRTSCNKRGSFNKKACHFKKHVSFVSKLCFVCGSRAHLIKDCDFYEKKMANLTVGIGMGHAVRPQSVPTSNPMVKPVPTGQPKVKPVPTGQPKVKPVPTGRPKVNPVPTAKPKVRSIPTGKPQVTSPAPAGRPYRPFPVPTDRGYSPLVMSGWWSHTPSPIYHLLNPTSLYFQTYTPYVPTMYYNNIQYGGDRWVTTVKPSVGCSWKENRKGFHWVPKNNGGSNTSPWPKLSDPQGRPKP
nr:hypothetical protein [Tanacetum cinerariifolium]